MKKIYTIALTIAILLSTGCQYETTSMKKVNFLTINKQVTDNFEIKDIYEPKKLSRIFYRKNFIYFFNTEEKILYKFSRAGDNLLTIKNKPLTSFPSMDFLYEHDDITTISTKVDTSFPFPEIIDFYVDYDENIYLKAVPNLDKNLPEDEKINYTTFINDEHPGKYLFGDKTENDELGQNIITSQNSTRDINEFRDFFNFEDGIDSNNAEITESLQDVYYIKLNKFGKFEAIILNSNEYPYFLNSWNINPIENGNFILSQKIYSDSDSIIQNGYKLYLFSKDFNLLNTMNFLPTNLEKYQKIKNEITQAVTLGYDITRDGTVYFQTIVYLTNKMPNYESLERTNNFNEEQKEIKYENVYVRELIISIDDGKKKGYSSAYYYLGSSLNEYHFCLKYRDEKTTYLALIDDYSKKWIGKIIETADIESEKQFFLGENGFLLSYSEDDKNFYLNYWSTDLLLRRLDKDKEY